MAIIILNDGIMLHIITCYDLLVYLAVVTIRKTLSAKEENDSESLPLQTVS